MKKPVARKLPSGAWMCRVRVDGQDICITREKPELAEAEALAIKTGIIDGEKKPKRKTLTKAIDEYIEVRRNIISPSTIRGYKIIQDNRFQSMMSKDITIVTQEQWQRAVNAEAKRLSPKTLANSWRFLASVIAEATGKTITVQLPQIVPNERPWLTPEEIPTFVAAVKGTRVEIPALLALSSLRCSELLDLKWENIDLQKKVIHVTGSAVLDENGDLIHKRTNKNNTSRRTVPIIPPLLAALQAAPRNGEYVVTYKSGALYNAINRVCDANGLPRVGIHGLRHSFASLAFHLNMPEKVAMQIGGWANDQTMRKIYTHLSQAEVTKHAAAFTGFFDQKPEKTDAPKSSDPAAILPEALPATRSISVSS